MNHNLADNLNISNKKDLQDEQELHSPIEASSGPEFPFSQGNEAPVNRNSLNSETTPVVPSTSLPPRKRARTQEEKEQRRVERILRNRRAAHLSREKKKKYIEFLENSLIALIHGTLKYKALLNKLLEDDYKNPYLFQFVNENPDFINEKFQDMSFSEILEKISQNKNLNVSNGKGNSSSLNLANDDAYGSPSSTPTMMIVLDNSPSSSRKTSQNSELTSPIMPHDSHVDSFDSVKAKTVSPPSSYATTDNVSLPPKKLKITNPSIASSASSTNGNINKSTKGRKKKLGSPVPDFDISTKDSPMSPTGSTTRKNKKNLMVTTPISTTAPALPFDSFTSNTTFSATSIAPGSVKGIGSNATTNNIISSLRELPISPANQHQSHHSQFNPLHNVPSFPSHFSPSNKNSDEFVSNTQQGTILSSYLRSHHYSHSSNPSTPKSASFATFGSQSASNFKHNANLTLQLRISKTPPISSISPRVIPSRITLSPEHNLKTSNSLGIVLNSNKSFSSSGVNNITLPSLHQQPTQAAGNYALPKAVYTPIPSSENSAAVGASVPGTFSAKTSTSLGSNNRRRPSEVAAVAQLLNMNPQLDLAGSYLKNASSASYRDYPADDMKSPHAESTDFHSMKQDKTDTFKNGEEGEEEDAVKIMMSFKQGK